MNPSPLQHAPRWILWLCSLLLLLGTTHPSLAGWNAFVAQNFPGATDFDPQHIDATKPFILNDGKTTVIRQTTSGPLHFPHGIYVVGHSQLVIEEVTKGLQILTPFLIVEDGGALLAGGPDPTNRYRTPLEIVLTGIGNESSEDQGIDDPQLYSLFDLQPQGYVRSQRAPGDADPDEHESALFGNKVLAAGPQGRIELYAAKGTGLSWARLAASVDVDAVLNTNVLVVPGNVTGDWSVGDRVVVSTSDFEPDHTEEATIRSLQLLQKGTATYTQLTVDQIRNGVTQALTGNKDIATDGPGTSFQWSHYGERGDPSTADIRATVALLTRNIVVRSYRTEDAPRGALATLVTPIVDTVTTNGYAPPGQSNLPPGVKSMSSQEYYPGKKGDKLSRTSNRRDIYGGHALFRADSVVKLLGVEFSDLGQPGNFGRVGRYPVHFHLAKEATNSWVSHCSIHDSFNRWLSIHGTFGLGVTNNVGYRSFGHGFYIEDGVEQKNILDGNCGILARPALPAEFDYHTDPNWVGNDPKIPIAKTHVPQPFWNPLNVYPLTYLDRESPSVFWISNKQNYLRNNLAAGAAMGGRGFWLAGLQAEQRGGPAWRMVSADDALKAKYPYISGEFAPVLEFYNNTANSCWNGIGSAFDQGGMFNYATHSGQTGHNWDTDYHYAYDGDLQQDTGYTLANASPRALEADGQPPNSRSPSVIDMMARTTAFRNRQYGAWLRPFWWWISNSQFSDNVFGATLVSGGNEEAAPQGFWGLVSNSDFIGFSDNLYRNQSRAKIQAPHDRNSLTDRNPSDAILPDDAGTSPYTYPEVPAELSRNFYAGGNHGESHHERRGYQYYDGPGPVLSGVSFRGFYPTVDSTYPTGITPSAPQYDWNQIQWGDWFKTFTDPNNRANRHFPFLNAALGWFGPGNQWKYSALTWTTNLFFDPTVIVRHLVHDTYTYAGDFGDGDRQTFILDTDGSLQGWVGAGCVNDWPAHKGRDWAYECRSAQSCLGSPYHYGNTDILLNDGANTPAILFGKIQVAFRADAFGPNRSDDHRYFIRGVPVSESVRLYGTLNAAGARYTLQFRAGANFPDKPTDPQPREMPLPPPPDFAVRFTALENTPGRNSLGYAICFPQGTKPSDLKLSAALVDVYQGNGPVNAKTFRQGWDQAKDASAPLVSVTSTNEFQPLKLASGTVTAQWDDSRSVLLLTVTNTAPRSRRASPQGLCKDPNNPVEFIGREAVTRWTAMLPHMEAAIPEDAYPRGTNSIETVFETVAKSLNDSPDTGAICVAIRYTPPANPVMPDILSIVPVGWDAIYYDSDASALTLKSIEVSGGPGCYLSDATQVSYRGFQWANFSTGEANADPASDPTADPDGDGLTNLEEYWVGLNPLSRLGTNPGIVPGIITIDGVRYLTLQYRRAAGVNDLDFTVLRSDDLIHWQEDGEAHEIDRQNNADETQTVTVRTSRNVDALPMRYVRLRVSLKE